MASLTTLEFDIYKTMRPNQTRTQLLALLVRRLASEGMSYQQIAMKINQPSSWCGMVIRGDKMKNIPGGYPSPWYPYGRDAYAPYVRSSIWRLIGIQLEGIELPELLELRAARKALSELRKWLNQK